MHSFHNCIQNDPVVLYRSVLLATCNGPIVSVLRIDRGDGERLHTRHRGVIAFDHNMRWGMRPTLYISSTSHLTVHLSFSGLRGPARPYSLGTRFTKYLMTVLQLSYDNAKVTIELRRTSNLQNILRRTQGFSWVRFTCKIVRSSEIVFVN